MKEGNPQTTPAGDLDVPKFLRLHSVPCSRCEGTGWNRSYWSRQWEWKSEPLGRRALCPVCCGVGTLHPWHAEALQ